MGLILRGFSHGFIGLLRVPIYCARACAMPLGPLKEDALKACLASEGLRNWALVRRNTGACKLGPEHANPSVPCRKSEVSRIRAPQRDLPCTTWRTQGGQLEGRQTEGQRKFDASVDPKH